jgi:putative transposase
MPRLVPVPIDIGSEERRKLETLARAHSTPQQLAERARIILLAADTVGVHETARRLGIWPKTVRRWRARWLESTSAVDIGARRADAPRPGVKPKFTAEQICAIVALACEPPEATDHPLEPIGTGSPSSGARDRPRDLPQLGRALFKKNLTSSRIWCG